MIPLCYPSVIVIKNRICQIIIEPVKICIYPHFIACRTDRITKSLRYLRNLCFTDRISYSSLFQIIKNRIAEIIPFYQSQNMFCLTLCLCHGICIRIQINPKGDPVCCTCICIDFPFFIILTCYIRTITASDHCIIYICVFHFCPVDIPIPLADINSLSCRSVNYFSPVIIKSAVIFRPRSDRSGRICRNASI